MSGITFPEEAQTLRNPLMKTDDKMGRMKELLLQNRSHYP
jgi:hypothetical protein